MNMLLEDSLVVDEIHVPGYEKIIRVTQDQVGLDAIICIHTTSMGPALGGTRIFPYPHFGAALNDVLRLAKGMTYKSAVAQCGWGGGKSVIIADPRKGKTEELLTAFGLAVDRLQGVYICAEDVGSSPLDMGIIRKVTPYVVGLCHPHGSGNPSPFTAWGTYRGIQATLKRLFGSESVAGRTIAIQGLGSVGARLAEFLFWHGARLWVSDVNEERVQEIVRLTRAEVVSPEEITRVPCDIFAPCAMGGVIHREMIPNLQCAAVAGAANNQLLEDEDAELLREKGILYAPDFVINAGGLINVTFELAVNRYNPIESREQTDDIFNQLMTIYDIADQNQCSTQSAALSLGEYRIKYRIGKRKEPPRYLDL